EEHARFGEVAGLADDGRPRERFRRRSSAGSRRSRGQKTSSLKTTLARLVERSVEPFEEAARGGVLADGPSVPLPAGASAFSGSCCTNSLRTRPSTAPSSFPKADWSCRGPCNQHRTWTEVARALRS